MKNILTISFFSMTLLFASCNSGSTKGKWTTEDKKTFSDECLNFEEVKTLGGDGIKLCSCMLNKSEAEFNSYSEANSDEAKMTAIGEACATEIMAE